MKKKTKNLSILLKNYHKSLYWTGFLLADGTFPKDNSLQLVLSKKDEIQLKKFKTYVSSSNSIQDVPKVNAKRIKIVDTNIVKKFKKKYNISNIKTYTPPHFHVKNDNLFLSLLIGYIDGDGCIKFQNNRRDTQLSINVHKNWSKLMEIWINRVYKVLGTELYNINIRNKVKVRTIKNSNCCNVNLGNSEILWKLRTHTIKYNLPILYRKWKIIKPPKLRYKKARDLKSEVKNLKSKGLINRLISKKLNISESYVSLILQGKR